MCGDASCSSVTVTSSRKNTINQNTELVTSDIAAGGLNVHFFFVAKFDPVEVAKPETRPIKRDIAPYNGFGSLEDSLATCTHLIPKPPRK